MRIVPDTNVLVSGFTYPRSIPGKIISAWKQKKIDFCLSHFIIDEFKRVLPALKHNELSASQIRELSEVLIFFSDVVEPDSMIHSELRDPNDQLILGTLAASGADYLITGDNDLLILSDMFPIITPRAFWDRFGF